MSERATWDQYGSRRLLSRNRLLFPRHRLVACAFLDFFAGIDSSQRVLDIGCGDGFFMELLRDLGFEHIRGIDLSEPSLNRAREKGLHVEKRDVYDVGSMDWSFDIALMMDVLEHLPEPRRALEEVREALPSSGLLYVDVPVCDSVQLRLRRLLKGETRKEQSKRWDETHVYAPSARELVRLVHRSGYAVRSARRLSNRWPRSGSLRPTLRLLLQAMDFGGVFGDLMFLVASKR